MIKVNMVDIEERLYPLAKAAEEAGRWELLQGIILSAIALADLDDSELTEVVARLNIAVANQLITARHGNNSILESVGLTREKIAQLEALAKEQNNAGTN